MAELMAEQAELNPPATPNPTNQTPPRTTHTPDLHNSPPSPFVITGHIPTQEQVDPLLTMWNEWQGDDPYMNSVNQCLLQDLSQLGREVNTPPYKFLPVYLRINCNLQLWDASKATALCFFMAVHYHNPTYVFPNIELPQFNLHHPFPTFRATITREEGLQIQQNPQPQHTSSLPAGTHPPATTQPTPKDFQVGTVQQTAHQQKVYDQFVQNMQKLVPPSTPSQPIPQLPMGTPTPATTNLHNGIQWDQATNSYTKNSMLIKYNHFKFKQSKTAELNWSPDIKLSTHVPPNHSLTKSHQAQYHNYQTFLQHLHFDLQYPEDQLFPIQYNPKYIQPQGIAGAPAVILLMESYIKEMLVADRYCQYNQITQLYTANVELAFNLRQEAPETWHLPLTKLFTHTDAQIKLRGNTTKLHTNKTTPQYDKHTQRALETLPTNTPTHTPQHKTPYNSPQHNSPQHNTPTPYTHTQNSPNPNYKGNNYDPNFKHPNSLQRPNYYSSPPKTIQGGGSNQGRR